MNEIVYKVPGKNAGPKGKTYDWKPVKSEDEFNQAIESGWFDTLEEAINGKHAKSVKLAKPEKNDDAPTREEILTKANELELEFPRNISSKKLLALIKQKLSTMPADIE